MKPSTLGRQQNPRQKSKKMIKDHAHPTHAILVSEFRFHLGNTKVTVVWFVIPQMVRRNINPNAMASCDVLSEPWKKNLRNKWGDSGCRSQHPCWRKWRLGIAEASTCVGRTQKRFAVTLFVEIGSYFMKDSWTAKNFENAYKNTLSYFYLFSLKSHFTLFKISIWNSF